MSFVHSLQAHFNDQLSQFLQAHIHLDTLVIAFSGGLDSRVLLQLATHFIQENTLQGRTLGIRALHVNHGLHPSADAWQSFCETVCADRACEFHSTRVNLDAGSNLEEQARRSRYQYFENMCSVNDVLLTAHHGDDQVETILFRLFRGAGPTALAGMPTSRELGQSVLYRPLLDQTRAELLQYAREQDLQWVEDESNQNEHFSRNFLRHSILPLLRERWPNVDTSILRSAELLAEQTDLVEALAQEYFESCRQVDSVKRMSRWGDCISLPVFLSFSKAQQAQVLRFWLKQRKLRMPDRQHLLDVIGLCYVSDANAHAQVSWHDRAARLRIYWRVYDQHLFLLHESLDGDASDVCGSRVWQVFRDGPVTFAGRRYFSGKAAGVGLSPELDVLQIRQRKGGERCKPFARSHSQSLKKLLQEYRVPPWQRDCLPLFYYNDTLVAVADLWLCDEFISHDETAWRIESAPLS